MNTQQAQKVDELDGVQGWVPGRDGIILVSCSKGECEIDANGQITWNEAKS